MTSTEIVPMPRIVSIAQRSQRPGPPVMYLLHLVDSRKPAVPWSHTVVIGGTFNSITVREDEVEGVQVLTKHIRRQRSATMESAMRSARGAWLVIWPEEEDAL